jgi:hypothetical protein
MVIKLLQKHQKLTAQDDQEKMSKKISGRRKTGLF